MSHELTVGKKGSLTIMRNHLQKEHNMLQIWAGKVENDTDYIVFVGEKIHEFAILTSPGGSNEYTLSSAGDVVFMHSKNLRKLARMNDS